jgi:hypothetical protein
MTKSKIEIGMMFRAKPPLLEVLTEMLEVYDYIPDTRKFLCWYKGIGMCGTEEEILQNWELVSTLDEMFGSRIKVITDEKN